MLLPNKQGYLLQVAGAVGPMSFDSLPAFAGQVLLSQRAQMAGWRNVVASELSLPFATGALAAVLLIHVFDYQQHSHPVIKEVDRVLQPEGQLIICGFNPWGLCNLMRIPKRYSDNTHTAQLKSLNQLCRLLTEKGFRVEQGQTLFHGFPGNPPISGLLDRLGHRLLPALGSIYLISARKRVAAVTPLRKQWRATAQRKPVIAPSSALEAAD